MSNSLPIFLGVNVDHVATVRQARQAIYPDPVHCALIAEDHGADGITVHLREDKRHIQPRDVILLKQLVKTHLNFEMAATDEMVNFALEVLPDYCCIVPEKRNEVTTEGGLAVIENKEYLKKITAKLKERHIKVSYFIDADERQILASKEAGATIVELHTGPYAHTAKDTPERHAKLKQLQDAAAFAYSLGLQVNAGHGLHYHNVWDIAKIPEMTELNIGHAIVGHALVVGFAEAVAQMKKIMLQARGF
ncbi:pyridoxine 5'-phosphate synthase [Candidatus Berkiella aquae]|uniref:Pyridoxine 5'-phosphate synthase n=1 Tax=Candidatus Berkiella aquae TaxID=295108 RepID=A0A0Q9YWF5_9GAMM|nr:pyridoxine 5'-phosphate synthase [Candidatus Berkiella aquae]MCS5711088.1 pyridoxine 5'-phosphate synthase [Candidatus Berkiella aquae]